MDLADPKDKGTSLGEAVLKKLEEREKRPGKPARGNGKAGNPVIVKPTAPSTGKGLSALRPVTPLAELLKEREEEIERTNAVLTQGPKIVLDLVDSIFGISWMPEVKRVSLAGDLEARISQLRDLLYGDDYSAAEKDELRKVFFPAVLRKVDFNKELDDALDGPGAIRGIRPFVHPDFGLVKRLDTEEDKRAANPDHTFEVRRVVEVKSKEDPTRTFDDIIRVSFAVIGGNAEYRKECATAARYAEQRIRKSNRRREDEKIASLRARATMDLRALQAGRTGLVFCSDPGGEIEHGKNRGKRVDGGYFLIESDGRRIKSLGEAGKSARRFQKIRERQAKVTVSSLSDERYSPVEKGLTAAQHGDRVILWSSLRRTIAAEAAAKAAAEELKLQKAAIEAEFAEFSAEAATTGATLVGNAQFKWTARKDDRPKLYNGVFFLVTEGSPTVKYPARLAELFGDGKIGEYPAKTILGILAKNAANGNGHAGSSVPADDAVTASPADASSDTVTDDQSAASLAAE